MMYDRRMRTTIDLPEHLLVEAKKHAAERRVSMTLVVEESLRAYLSEQRVAAARVPAELPVLRGPKPRAAVDLNDTSGLWEL